MIGFDDLQAALPHVLAAPKNDAPVTGLCFRPGVGERIFPDHLRLTVAEGVPGDRWLSRPWLRLPDGRPHPAIQVSILPQRVLDLVWRDRTQPHPGDPVIADLDTSEENLPIGSLLRVGTAVVRVSDVFNDGCVKWKVRYGAEAKNWITSPGHPALRLRGILCSVEQDGEVRVGNRIVKL
ncbi:MOSC domain-containing protein [Falsirhodobacter sp. 1013]|uniref:MOSC domain-containing protein n=1 Tax=Falsirhodobacter sp. 1013 TaxID=3417566 RepID=UPI003EB87AAD